MNDSYNFFAFDLGATSGRSILGTLSGGRLTLKELTRFPNKIISVHGRYYWDILALYDALKDGLREASALGVKIDAVGIDTWGVDFVCIGKDGSVLGQPRSYRDPYTDGAPEEYFKSIPKEEVYSLTGIQIMNFNSLFQLYASHRDGYSVVESTAQILFMPDALSYLLTGNKVCEYTIASTSQLINAYTKRIEPTLLKAAGVSPDVVLPVVMPGQKVGDILDSVARECGLAKTPVIAVAGHDTASAVVAVPAENERFAYLSSGTWSLMGIEVPEPIINEQSRAMNFTNEGGADGSIRFLKNITGMWLLEQCRKEWEHQGRKYTYEQITSMAESAEVFRSLVDPDHPSFANPVCMTDAIAAYCKNTGQAVPQTDAQFVRAIFESLALKYRCVLDSLQRVAPFRIEKLHIIGGGSQNHLLNQFTANAIGMDVAAGPSEATAIGNILMQAKGIGILDTLDQMRQIVRDSVPLTVFCPKDTAMWEEAYSNYTKLIKY